MDVENLDKDQDYRELPDTYVIFITEKDYYKAGKPVYVIQNICIYFLMDTADAGLLERQNTFTRTEGTDTHIFKWLEIAQLKDETFYPLFLKKEISNLPDGFTIRTEVR